MTNMSSNNLSEIQAQWVTVRSKIRQKIGDAQFASWIKLLTLESYSDQKVTLSVPSNFIRTRIIESFVRGLPVISTNVAAIGMHGLEDRKNIFLANSAVEISDILSDILSGKEQLGIISNNARSLYKEQYSSEIQAKFLKEYIDQYIN